ncbi:MAG: nucleotidyl transferase AbiEii/AbiGii toxin family protein [Nanoarchaeota archaeon]|nr:nucleotidyl transferase AbiEii/AbiGii toxin family protein [Nanoarchaeota archaeon]MBU1269691.1 nucleotidyl transferase AbiEii/AbiGii toxin family protein [Nanoarchaeota archaeon]MBU1605127.1 nucleotidyl transferase AbiEii/AbiGii toxin family protein [Nanoarchaeota archaeon]MBU2442920.1 nucleotidyl transferase AbiEii/AbiGii toxin family protein [Nanoarchaeota archaeon]
MISLERLREYARRKDYNLGQAEKDYFQEIILFILYKEFGKELVFKGGTALTKCFGFDRFSEDLDFNLMEEKDIKRLLGLGLDSFYITHELEEEKSGSSESITCRVQGPLYNGARTSLCKVSMDFSLREKALLEPGIVEIGLYIDEIPSFRVVVMDREEILAEKIRAIYTRNKARDLYDVYYLIKTGVRPDVRLIDAKLSMYSLSFSLRTLTMHLEKKQAIWDSEMKHLTKSYPGFDEAKKAVISRFRRRH